MSFYDLWRGRDLVETLQMRRYFLFVSRLETLLEFVEKVDERMKQMNCVEVDQRVGRMSNDKIKFFDDHLFVEKRKVCVFGDQKMFERHQFFVRMK